MVYNNYVMHHFRRILQLGVVLTCLFWGFQQVDSQALAQADVLTDKTAVISEDDQDIANQYPGLPVAVAKAIRSVVATRQILNSATGQGSVASGVVIGDQQILTAGHTIMNNGALQCGSTAVLASGVASSATASTDTVSMAAMRYGNKSDLAVLTINASDNFKSVPDISISTNAPKAGDKVYFINYQPTSDGTVRNPTTKDVNAKPAVFEGTVLGARDGQLVIAAGYSKSFGQGAADNMLRKGASGGAIVDADGELVGLSVASDSLTANHSAASIARNYDVTLSNRHSYQLAYMQAVNFSLIQSVQASTVSCK